jgi:hypothetical protein
MKTAGVAAGVCLLMVLSANPLVAQDYVKESGPKLFSYDELVQLSLDQEMSPDLSEKLKQITTTPFINNEAYLRGKSCSRAFSNSRISSCVIFLLQSTRQLAQSAFVWFRVASPRRSSRHTRAGNWN